MYIAIWCTYCIPLFDIVSTIVEAPVIALHQFLYPFLIEWCHLWCKASGNGFFDLRHNFVKKWPWNLRKMQGKWRNESSVLPNLLFNCTHQIFIHHRQSATPRIIVRIFTSFIKQSHPCPYHWTTHGMCSIHVTKLTMNFSRCPVLRIQEMDYRTHFTCGRILCFLKHYKHTAQCVNTVRMSANSVCALPQNQQTRHACAPSWPQRCRGNILQTELIFWITLIVLSVLSTMYITQKTLRDSLKLLSHCRGLYILTQKAVILHVRIIFAK